jgi:hypothetical protein
MSDRKENLCALRASAVRSSLLAALCVATVLRASPCSARVFNRWGTAAQSTRALTEAGGRAVYESDVRVNGGRGTLTVMNFETPIRETVGTLAALFQARFEFSNGTMATGTAAANGHRLRLILIAPDSPGRTVLFKFDQSAADADASRKPEITPPLPGVGPFPGSAPEFSADDERGGYRFTVSRAAADPAAVEAYFASCLAAAGWAVASPAVPRRTEASLRIYTKQSEVCVVQAQASARAGATRITVLHKRPGTSTNTRLQ